MNQTVVRITLGLWGVMLLLAAWTAWRYWTADRTAAVTALVLMVTLVVAFVVLWRMGVWKA